MRTKIVVSVLTVMLLVLVVALIARSRPLHKPGVLPPVASGSASVAVAGSSSAVASASASGDAGVAPRVLRVVAPGWDLLAPGLLANGGKDPEPKSVFSQAGMEVHLAPVDGVGQVEAALARGGSDKEGADIAILPLPELVASFDHLRALQPTVFMVVGWSHGRESLSSTRDTTLSPPTKGDVTLVTTAGTSASLLGLWMLDLAGVPGQRVKIVAPPASKDVSAYVALDRRVPAGDAKLNLLVTTGDIPRLIPIVAVAQAGLVDRELPLLIAWSKAWMEGQKQARVDAAGSARTIGGMPGAPEPLALLERLGELEPASLADAAKLMGLSGRGAVTLDSLFRLMWQQWKSIGLLTMPTPEQAPIHPGVVASLVRGSGSVAPSVGDPNKPGTRRATADTPLVVRRFADNKGEDGWVAELGMLAGLFERSSVRVAVSAAGGGVDAARSKALITSARDRFDIPEARMPLAKKLADKSYAVMEVMPVP